MKRETISSRTCACSRVRFILFLVVIVGIGYTLLYNTTLFFKPVKVRVDVGNFKLKYDHKKGTVVHEQLQIEEDNEGKGMMDFLFSQKDKMLNKILTSKTSIINVTHANSNMTSSTTSRLHAHVPLYQDNILPIMQKPKRTKIAVASALILNKLKNKKDLNLEKECMVFGELTNGICKTASKEYDYGLYLTYDNTDPLLSKPDFNAMFAKKLKEYINKMCKPRGINLDFRLIMCPYSHKVAWAQSDAVVEAYFDGYDYFYRLNDDTSMITPDWSKGFIDYLRHQVPTNVGATCPDHLGDFQGVWQYDFVHKRHIEIHGVHYPRLFWDWKDTDWITYVYGKRGVKVKKYKIRHTMSKGTRYAPKDPGRINKARFDAELNHGKYLIQKYIDALQLQKNVNHKKIISFSANGSSFDQIYGLVRNAQLAKIFFPTWTVRAYIFWNTQCKLKLCIPDRYINILRGLNVQIAQIGGEISNTFPSHVWKYMVADDTNVERFIVRDVEHRISERDAKLVAIWESSNKGYHFIIDGKPDEKVRLLDTWGSTRAAIKKHFGGAVTFLLNQSATKSKTILEGKLKQQCNDTLIHKSVPNCPFCNCLPILLEKPKDQFYVGQKFAAYEMPV